MPKRISKVILFMENSLGPTKVEWEYHFGRCLKIWNIVGFSMSIGVVGRKNLSLEHPRVFPGDIDARIRTIQVPRAAANYQRNQWIDRGARSDTPLGRWPGEFVFVNSKTWQELIWPTWLFPGLCGSYTNSRYHKSLGPPPPRRPEVVTKSCVFLKTILNNKIIIDVPQ